MKAINPIKERVRNSVIFVIILVILVIPGRALRAQADEITLRIKHHGGNVGTWPRLPQQEYDYTYSAEESMFTFKEPVAVDIFWLNQGGVFKSWSGACKHVGTFPQCSLVINKDTIVTAHFKAWPKQYGAISIDYEGAGRVISQPVGIDCSAGSNLCEGAFKNGEIGLLAVPDYGWEFAGWTENFFPTHIDTSRCRGDNPYIELDLNKGERINCYAVFQIKN